MSAVNAALSVRPGKRNNWSLQWFLLSALLNLLTAGIMRNSAPQVLSTSSAVSRSFIIFSLSFHIIAPFLILNSYINSSSLSHQFSLKHLLDLYLGFFLSTDFHANRCSVHFSSDRKIPLNLRADLHKNLFIQRKLTGFYQTITLTFWPLYTDSAVEKNKNNLYLGR